MIESPQRRNPAGKAGFRGDTSNCSGSDYTAQFRAAIVAAGMDPPESITADGTLQRFASNGKRGDAAGWYVFYPDGIAAGSFGCWRSGVIENWCADVGRGEFNSEVHHSMR